MKLWPRRKRKERYMTDATGGDGPTNEQAAADELAAREAAVAEREAALDKAEASGPQRSDLLSDDPRAGTVDDESVTDPYAHLRNKAREQGVEEPADTDEENG